MSYRIKVCNHCKKEFTATHGNREYCPESDCQGTKTAVDQKKYYEVGKDILTRYVGNYKLFDEALGNDESKTVEVQEFQVSGFDPNAFYGLYTDDTGTEWCRVKDYAFHIFHQKSDHKSYLTIKKISA